MVSGRDSPCTICHFFTGLYPRASLIESVGGRTACRPYAGEVGFPMGSEDSSQPGASGRAASAKGGHRPLQLASAVMFVAELDLSVDFYREFLGWDVTVHSESAALLVGPEGDQVYVRTMGSRAQHPLGNIGVQYLIWTAYDEGELHRCEQVLRKYSSQVINHTVEGFSWVEGSSPDDVPVIVTYPGPDQVPRHEILQRIYRW